ncbi:microfibril-associated glycoprotein 4-like [Saccostrea cucullata]|uniref:microfibril-associated glycoprotein 4-like n=1 Tax=Saccostrea cuccullata TaxID=36930 RepID=UPI002ED3284F
MSKVMVVFLIAGYFIVPHTAMFSRRYIRNMDFDDKKSDGELLGEYSLSFKDCAEKCRGDCGVFGYNDGLKKCRLHRKLNMSSASEETDWRYFLHEFTPTDCKDLQENNYTKTGVYDIYPYGISFIPVRVYCDMDTMDGGWTAIQKRVNGFLSFDKDWTAYKNGFGDPEQDLWVGNDVIHQLTKEKSVLYVSITLEGDSMLDTGYPKEYLSGMYFSTPDRDNDLSRINCAARSEIRGGWWFNACHYAFLNGPWSPANWGYPWWPPLKSGSSIRRTVMMIKRH